MKKLHRAFYVGMITTENYGRLIGEKVYAGAASRKMTSVAGAMRSVGHRAVVVSLPFVGTRSKRAYYSACVTSEGGAPAIFLATLRSKYLRKIVGPFIVAAFALCRVRAGDTVILYNHAAEYVLALTVLRLRGIKVVQDIEDVPTDDERGARGWFNRIFFKLTFHLTDTTKMVVADHVAQKLKLSNYVVVRGVASDDAGGAYRPNPAKWEDLRGGGELKLHFGGTLIPETGIDLFCETVELLARDETLFDRRISFKVTGIGDLDKIRALQCRIGSKRNIQVELLPELSKVEYVALIGHCHGSLSLKRPGSDMANTTFPSKVIEITTAGLALVSTRLGDVTTLFSDESAFFLPDYTAADLAGIFRDMARNPGRVEHLAKNGNEISNRTFSTKTVGEDMTRLL